MKKIKFKKLKKFKLTYRKLALLLIVLSFPLFLLHQLQTSVNASSCNPLDNPCWETKTPMPTARRDLGVASDSFGKVYAVGGYDGVSGPNGFLTKLEVYDPATDTWTTKASMPTPRNVLGFIQAPNGKFYAAGGFNGSGNFPNAVFDALEEYDPNTDIWTTKSPMPTARQCLRLAADASGKIYAIGGLDRDNVRLNTVEAYDPVTDSWTTKSPMPTARMCLGVVTAPNGKIYAIGGTIDDAGTSTNKVEEYDPATDIWTTKAPMPTARDDSAVSINAQGNIYVIGGSISSPYTNTVEEYNPNTDTWTTRTVFPTEIFAAGAALGNDAKVHVLGGQTNTSPAVNTHYAGFVSLITPTATPIPTPNAPINKDQCKNGGWKTFTDPSFRSQGECQKFVKNSN